MKLDIDAAGVDRPPGAERVASQPEHAVLRRTLGGDFARLHPRLREQYEIWSGGGRGCVGRGIMERIWHGPAYVWPFLYVGSLRRIMFLDAGRDVPFSFENFAYLDGAGRETLSWIRTFEFPRPRRFDEWFIFSDRRGKMLAYAGSHQHLAVEIDARIGPGGSLEIRTGIQRVFAGPIGIRVPQCLSGRADVRQWYNERAGYFEIDVHVGHPVFGPIFGYRGWYQLEWVDGPPETIPARAQPVREQRRE